MTFMTSSIEGFRDVQLSFSAVSKCSRQEHEKTGSKSLAERPERN